MALTHNLGFPRIGARRELKHALEAYWHGNISGEQLQTTAAELRKQHWALQRDIGIDLIPVGDFAFYDQMLNMTALLGAVPARFNVGKDEVGLDLYFAMARGTDNQPAMEMTKWFDTNYHYIVPEFNVRTKFCIASSQLFKEVAEAKMLGIVPKVVLIGPLTYLYLGKETEPGFNRLDLLPNLLFVYRDILTRLTSLGVEWVQIDEPVLALDLDDAWLCGLDQAYVALHGSGTKVLLTTYFEGVDAHADLLKKLPVNGLHIDLCRSPQQLDTFLADYPVDKVLSLGIIDGRNVWRTDLEEVLVILSKAQSVLCERIWIAPSCSLLHCPVDLELETRMDADIKNWLAFSVQKLKEISILGCGLNQGKRAISGVLAASTKARQARAQSLRIHNPVVQKRLQTLPQDYSHRTKPFEKRQVLQRKRFQLPIAAYYYDWFISTNS